MLTCIIISTAKQAETGFLIPRAAPYMQPEIADIAPEEDKNAESSHLALKM